MKRLLTSFSAAVLAASLGLSAHAQAVQGLDGRWEGPVSLGNGATITAVIRVVTKDGVTTTVFDSPDQGAKDIPASVKREGDSVTFEVPSAMLTYSAKLSADGTALTGDLGQGGGGSVPVTMTRKPASAVAALTGPAVAGLDGQWDGSIDTQLGALPVVFRLSTAAGKTTTRMDAPSQSALDIPALAKREGQKVSIEVPGVGGKFDADLSADGKTLKGFWDQNGASLPLTMIRK